jgi:uncharacterized protein (DUF2147 family)
MKTTTILLAVSLFSNLSNAQVLNEEMIVGLWKSGNQKVMVKIDRLGSIYQGRIIWLSDSGGGQRQTDVHNPVEQLRSMPLIGNKIIQKMSFNADEQRWEGGTFYDFESGKTYRCIILLEGPRQLKISKFVHEQEDGTTEKWFLQSQR